MHRCSWVNDDPLYIDYHDHEWGKPVYDDQKLYEMFLLETFQAGLSWITILHKREAFKEAFDQFDVNKIAMYDDCKINELMNNPKIIRNSRKIKAAVKNAQIFKYRKNMVLFLNIYGLIQMIKLFMKKKRMKQRVRYQIKFLRI